MNAVSNASPLVSLARIGELESLQSLFETVYISWEVYDEVVVAGAGLPGASAVANAPWIQVVRVADAAGVRAAQAVHGLGAGETSAVQLALEKHLPLVLMDERRGRKYARQRGLDALGCVGLLEALFRRGRIVDLRKAYSDLLAGDVRIDSGILRSSLAKFGLPPL